MDQIQSNNKKFIGIILAITLLWPPLLIIVSTVLFYKDQKQWRTAILCFSIGIAFISYYFPIGSGDLATYFNMIRQISTVSLKKAFDYFDDNLYARNIIFWFLGKINEKELLPAITGFATYYVAMYISCSAAESYGKLAECKWILPLQLMLLNYTYVINIVRSSLAFTLISLAFFQDVFNKKRNIWTIVLYVVPCFIHTIGILVCFVRLMCGLFKNNIWPVVSMVTIVVLGINPLFQLSKRLPNIFLVTSAIERTYYYFYEESQSWWAQEVANSPWQTVQRWVFFFLVLFILFEILVFHRRDAKGLDMDAPNIFYSFFIATSVLALLCDVFITGDVYHRFAIIIFALLGAIYLKIEELLPLQMRQMSFLFLIAFGLMRTTLQVYQLVNNFDLIGWIYKFVTFNGLFLIGKIIQTLIST